MHHPYLSEEKQQQYLAHLATRAQAWPVPVEERTVDTSWGATFMRISGPVDAPPLVLLPGGGTTSLMWTPMVAGLAAKYRVYALDSVMDLGRSVRSRDAKNADDLCAWLDEVLQALALGPEVRLMGMSHGGWLAANFATRFPERVKQLVLLAPAAWVEDLPTSLIFRMLLMFLPPRRYWMRRIYRATLPDLAATAQGPALIDAMTEDLALAFECYPLRELGKTVPPLKASDEALRSLRVPTLFVVGEHERIYDPATAFARLERVAPQVQRVLVRGAGHDLPWLKADEVNARVLAFFDEPSAR